MKIRTTVFLLYLFTLLSGKAQQPEEVLSRWVSQSPVEKIYLQFDRNDYIAGQTIWFKSYLYSDYLPGRKSTDIFIELFNSTSVLAGRYVFPVFGGFSHG